MILLFAASFIGYCILHMAFELYESSEVPLIVCVQIILVAYLVSLFAKINIISDILFYGGFAALGLGLYLKRKDLRGLLDKLLSPAFLFFLIFCAGLYILCGPVVCVYPDEIAHYGLLPKYLLSFDKLPGVNSVVQLINYPPGTALLQYHTARFTGGSEGMVFFGQMLLYAALLTIVLKKIGWKKLWLGLIALALAIVVLFKFREYNFISLYTDQIAAMAGFFIAASYLKSDRRPRDILKLLPIAFFAPLIRESGVGFAVFGAVLIFVDALFTKSRSQISPEGKKPFLLWAHKNSAPLSAALLIATALLSYQIWNLYVDTFQILTYRGLLDGQRIVSGLKDFLKLAFEVFNQFVQMSIVDSPGGWAIITTPAGAALLLATICLVINILLKAEGRDEKNTRAVLVTVFIELLLFTLGLAFSYFYLFTEVEGRSLAAFPRYMGTIIVYCGLVVTYSYTIVLDRLEQGTLRQTIARSIAVVIILMMFIATYPIRYNLNLSRNRDNSQQAAMDERTAGIRSILDSDDKVYQIWQGDFNINQSYNFCRFSLMVETNTWSWSIGPPYYDNDIYTSQYSAEEWAGILVDGGYDYVFLGKPDTRLWSTYGVLFDVVDNPNVDVYKITPGGEFLLTAWDTQNNAPYQAP